ncbi:MAG TPA: hypothetical protein VGC30_06205, partial [Dokdonella sp.]
MNASPDTLRDLFEAALALPRAERAAFLRARCADAGVRAQVEAMLRADESVGEAVSSERLERLASAIGPGDDGAEAPVAGSRIGPFALGRVLGEGGSSTVFEATRAAEGIVQRVALKLLHRGVFGADARRRFVHEQRALLRLRHPHIARMIEGGVTDAGLAYIALE